MFDSIDIICIGESLIELSADESLAYAEKLNKYFGGDTIATAVAASKLGAKVGYITVIGNDYLKDFLLDACACEGLDTSQIRLSDDGSNGLYFVARCKNGSKEYVYYRKRTAATKLSEEYIDSEYIQSAKIVYSTGITQSLSQTASDAVLKAFKIAKENGVKVAYDINYTSRIWDVEEAKEAVESILPYIDILFCNFDHDIKPLYGINSAELVIKTAWDKGISTIVVREANGNISIGYNGEIITRAQIETPDFVDSTGSGDAFNGAFLYGLSQGYTPFEALRLAIILSYYQVQGIGAIKSIPDRDTVLNHYNSQE
ncbi:MAG: sugar kinase [bacterium]|nr:sugar kinase [bacterium]